MNTIAPANNVELYEDAPPSIEVFKQALRLINWKDPKQHNIAFCVAGRFYGDNDLFRYCQTLSNQPELKEAERELYYKKGPVYTKHGANTVLSFARMANPDFLTSVNQESELNQTELASNEEQNQDSKRSVLSPEVVENFHQSFKKDSSKYSPAEYVCAGCDDLLDFFINRAGRITNGNPRRLIMLERFQETIYDVIPRESRKEVPYLQAFIALLKFSQLESTGNLSAKDAHASSFYSWARDCSDLDKKQLANLKKHLDNYSPDRNNFESLNSYITSFEQAEKVFRKVQYFARGLLFLAQLQEQEEAIADFLNVDYINFPEEKAEANEQYTKQCFDRCCLALSAGKKKIVFNQDEIIQVANEAERKLHEVNSFNGSIVKSGYPLIDNAVDGYYRNEISVIAAHTGIGKTWIGIDAARRVATYYSDKGGSNILWISLELDLEAMSKRFSANITGKPLWDPDGNYSDFYYQAKEDIWRDFFKKNNANLNLIAERLDISDIVGHIRTQSALCGRLTLVVVDYFQYISDKDSPKNTPKYEMLTQVSERLRAVAKEVQCPIFLTAQLNNPKNNTNADNTPSVYNLADSTSLGKEASLGLVMYEEQNEYGVKVLKMKVNKNRNKGDHPSFLVTHDNCGRYEFIPESSGASF